MRVSTKEKKNENGLIIAREKRAYPVKEKMFQ